MQKCEWREKYGIGGSSKPHKVEHNKNIKQ